MERLTPEQRLQIIEIFFHNSCCVKTVFRQNSTKILFSDEAHFWLNGYVNKQNCRIWDEEQPEEVQELPLHPGGGGQNFLRGSFVRETKMNFVRQKLWRTKCILIMNFVRLTKRNFDRQKFWRTKFILIMNFVRLTKNEF